MINKIFNFIDKISKERTNISILILTILGEWYNLEESSNKSNVCTN